MKDAESIFSSLSGKWTGLCRTWFEPGKLAGESPVEGSFELLMDHQFIRHTYTGTMQGKPSAGEATITFNSVSNKFQECWFDSFHMNYAIMFSEGDGTDDGFFVRGSYDVAANSPQWGWKTVYKIADEDRLTITAYNLTPSGEEAKAVEVDYRKVK